MLLLISFLKAFHKFNMKWIFTPALALLLIAPLFANAQHTQFTSQLQHAESSVYGAEGGAPTVGETIGIILQGALALLGVIFLVLTIYGGFLWMTAGGNDTQVAKAKNILVRAIIGLIIIAAAYSITTFVINALTAPPSISD